MPRVEEVFGANAGKVWKALNGSVPLTIKEITKKTKLLQNEVFGALGWLGREGKIEIVEDPVRGTLYKLLE
ncbi:MAG: winged helix-turn-helix domain-containing protein [Candidatus Aenigmarchaeota archaeon]|nr:winged helix-turn-helix domain-containing protein [Candidatus Aenigmarchaeota archaeon]